MKKNFLIPLLACSFCICAFAVDPVSVSDEAGLRAALQRTDGVQINLANDITGTKAGAGGAVSGTFYVPQDANVILNLAGHTLSVENPSDLNDLDPFAVICNNGNLTVIEEGDGMVMAPMSKTFSLSCFCEKEQNGFCFTNGGNLTINGGIFLGQPMGRELGFNYGNPVIFNQSDIVSRGRKGSLTINGGTFILPECSEVPLGGIIAGTENLVFNGGRFSSNQINTSETLEDKLGPGSSVESAAFSESYASWVSQVYLVSSAASSGITYAANATIEENVETTDVLVKAGVTVTLKKGYKITCDNLAFEDGTAQLIIEAGAAVIVNDEITAASVDNIHMTMDGRDNGDGNSYLLIKAGQIQESHPLATVVLKSKAYLISENPDRYAFQRFAVPTYLDGFRRDSLVYNHEAAPTAIYRWDYSANKWQSMANSDEFEPFQCYDMTTLATTAGQEYTFKARLVGNGNAELPLQGRWNYFANSYTAPIDIAPVIRYLYDDYQGDVSSSVYVHHANGNYWDVINVAQVLRNKLLQTTIEPMQAFVLERINPEANNPSIDYTSHVYNPFMTSSNNASGAPRRNTPVQLDFTFATMNVEAADGSHNTMEMYEGAQFDASFDNGFDVAKFMNEDCFNMYFAAQEGNMAYLASDNLANTAITLETKEATSYTINFADVTMEGYVLRDNLTGTETEIVSGNTYSFSAPANSKIEGRFEIVAAKLPTAIEDVEVKANVKGIYTLTGQYMGENFHVLPAGVYVINGKKVVK